MAKRKASVSISKSDAVVKGVDHEAVNISAVDETPNSKVVEPTVPAKASSNGSEVAKSVTKTTKRSVFDKDARKEEKRAVESGLTFETHGKVGETVATRAFKAGGVHYKVGDVVPEKTVKMLENTSGLTLKL